MDFTQKNSMLAVLTLILVFATQGIAFSSGTSESGPLFTCRSVSAPVRRIRALRVDVPEQGRCPLKIRLIPLKSPALPPAKLYGRVDVATIYTAIVERRVI